MCISAGSILDISKYRDTYERSISILDGIAILRYIEYRMIRRYLGDISYDPEYRPIRYLNNRRYGSIARKPRYRDYLLLIVRLSIHQTSILVSSIAKRFLVILKYRRTESIVHLPSNS